MNAINDVLTQISDMLGKLNGLPGGVLVLISCFVFGYGLKRSKKFPNEGIPVAVMLWGAIFNCIIADPKTDAVPFRIWLIKNAIVGTVLGFAAWLIHNKRKKIPLLKSFFEDEDGTQPPFIPEKT